MYTENKVPTGAAWDGLGKEGQKVTHFDSATLLTCIQTWNTLSRREKKHGDRDEEDAGAEDDGDNGGGD